MFYGVGFAITSLTILLLYYRALSQRTVLKLNALEIFETKAKIVFWLSISIPAILSAIAAWLLPTSLGVWSGFIYWLYPIISPMCSVLTKKRRNSLLLAISD